MLIAMRRVIVLALALALGVAASGCRDRELAGLRNLRDEVCACKTATCGADAMKKLPQDKVKSNHRSQQIARDMLDCLAKLYEAERPTTDPDAELPAGSAVP